LTWLELDAALLRPALTTESTVCTVSKIISVRLI